MANTQKSRDAALTYSTGMLILAEALIRKRLGVLIYRRVNTRANTWKNWYVLADTQKNRGVNT